VNISPIKTQLNFKGYDAAPLETIFLSGLICDKQFLKELEEVEREEKVPIKQPANKLDLWIQDRQTIVQNGTRQVLLAHSVNEGKLLRQLKHACNIRVEKSDKVLQGGNSFIGKKPNGDKWLLAGESELEENSIEAISKLYDIKPENIFIVQQQNYHLDMFLRPIGYPYILVNDPKTVLQNLDKIQASDEEKEDLKNTLKLMLDISEMQGYVSAEETVKKLKEYGFIPIKIGGCYDYSVNFMNAIVNKHRDNTISYITGSSRCGSAFYAQFEKMFEKELRAKVPNLDKVFFISGSAVQDEYQPSNFIMHKLKNNRGGLHCMTLEKPCFEIWA